MDTDSNKIVAYYNCNAVKAKDVKEFHSHPHHELFYFLSGQSQYYVEGTLYTMNSGDLLLINKGEIHTTTGTSALPQFRRIIIHFDDNDIIDTPNQDIHSTLFSRSFGKGNLFPHSLFNNFPWEHYLRQVLEAKDLHTQRLFLSTVLREMSIHYPKLSHNREAKGRPTEILNYINEQFSESPTVSDTLTIKNLCDKFHISHTYLNQIVQDLTGTTVGHYITIKRLHHARLFLQSGRPPLHVYYQVGFADYSAFYRAYRKLFGHSPSADYIRKKTDT